MNNTKFKKCYKKHLSKLFTFFICTVASVFNMNSSEIGNVTIKVKDELVQDVFSRISKQSHASFFFEEGVITSKQKVNLNFANAPVESVLDEIARQTSLDFNRDNNTITVRKSNKSTSIQQETKANKKISGTVTDETGDPLFGVTVSVKGTTTAVSTDIDGKYTLEVPDNAIVQFTYLGMKTVDISVSGKTTIDTVLQDDAVALGEVVAIGYGTVRKSDLTGALGSVTSKQFEDQNVTRVDQALQGRTSGVQVTSSVGAPGGDARIRIRGVNSVLGDNSPLFVIDGFVGGDFNMLNPNDIESIEVLKDASSTSVYGSRGANGVVIVTTKGGRKDGKVVVNYDGNVSLSSVYKKYDMMGVMDFIETANNISTIRKQSPPFSAEQIAYYQENGGFNYMDAIFRTAFSQQHQLSLSGGTQKTDYRISGNFLSQEGVLENSNYDRYTLRVGINTKITQKLSFRFNLNGARSVGHNNEASTGAGNPIVQAMSWAPTTNPYDANGGYTINDPSGSLKRNPLAWLYDRDYKNTRTLANIMAGVRYELIDGLAIDFQAGANFIFQKNQREEGIYLTNNEPNASVRDNDYKTIQTTTQVSYDKTLNTKHRINAVAAIETQKYRREELYGSANNLLFSNLGYNNLELAKTLFTSTYYENTGLLSYLARVNYSYDGKYLFTAAIRRDGSSKFADGNQFSTFPSLAVGWNLGSESFIQNLDIFSKLKLRASWGKTGSQAVDPYQTLDRYNNIYYAFDTGDRTSAIQLADPANKELKWETTTQTDLGIEFGFFNGRLTFDFDYFIKDTKDLLLNKSVPNYLGGGSVTSNAGKIQNKGFDLSISGTIIDNKDVSWESNLNLSYVKNKVKNLDGEERIFNNSNVSGTSTQPEFVYQVGQPLASFWGLKYLGVWREDQAEEAALKNQKPGDYHYSDDYQIIGCGLPTTTLGWNNTVRYKSFTFNMFWQGVFGIDKLNYSRGVNFRATGDSRYPTLAAAKNINYSESNKIEPQSSQFIEDASYLRLKNLSAAYTFKWINVADIKITASVTNLLTITSYKGMDPESSNLGGSGSDLSQSVDYGAYPNPRTFTLGVGVTF